MFGSFAREGTPCAVTALDDLGGGKFRFTAALTGADGRVHRQDGIFAFDGLDHPDGDGGTLAFARIDEHRYAIVSKGKLRGLAMRTVADDGAAMTETSDGTNDGDAFHFVRVYRRGPGNCE